MKLHARQKMLIHIYRRAAGLREDEYRRLLLENSGCRSSTQSTWTQDSFDAVLAALETVLFERVAQGRIENPIGRDRYIRAQFYWRKKKPGQGLINSRSVHAITQLWRLLCDYLPESDRTNAYFAGIVRKTTGRGDIGVGCLTTRDASRLIEALKDRLAYASRPSQIHSPPAT